MRQSTGCKALLKGNANDDQKVYVALAQMYSRLKEWPQAEENINKAIEMSTKPEDKSYALFVAGSIYERQKKYDKAEEAFHKVLADDPKNAMALNYLGYMLADRGTRLEEALGYIRRAVALDPQNGAYLDSLGWAYYKMGNYELAEENLRRAVDRMGDDPTIHEHLGELYLKTGTPEAGRDSLGAFAGRVEQDDSCRGRYRERRPRTEGTGYGARSAGQAELAESCQFQAVSFSESCPRRCSCGAFCLHLTQSVAFETIPAWNRWPTYCSPLGSPFSSISGCLGIGGESVPKSRQSGANALNDCHPDRGL